MFKSNYCFILNFLYKSINGAIVFIQSLIFKDIKKNDVKKILIYRVGTLGDNITAMPSIYNIIENYSNSQIDLLYSSGGNDALSIDKLIEKSYFSEIINYNDHSKKDLIKLLKSKKYSLIIELPSNLSTFFKNLRNMFYFRFFVGIKSGFGWKVSTIILFKRMQDKCIVFDNEIDRLQNILKDNDLKINNTNFILKRLNNEGQLYEKHNIYGDNNIAITVGAKRKQNQWPIEYFQKVVYFILERGCTIYIIGGKEDIETSSKLKINEKLINLCGRLTPIESSSILKKCKLLITNDTGVMHLAYAVDVPIIALFSAWQYDGKWYPPHNKSNKVLRDHNVKCKLCFNDKCKDNICMKNIKPQEIINELKKRNI
jgi:ADP-heptose:LPS heptosyltransferase